MNYRNIAMMIKNYLSNWFEKIYIYKPIPKDIAELNLIGKTSDGDFEVAFINRSGMILKPDGLGAKSGEFENVKGEKRQKFVITIFKSIKNETAFVEQFQNKLDEIGMFLLFADWSPIWDCAYVNIDVTEFYLLEQIVVHRADITLEFREQI